MGGGRCLTSLSLCSESCVLTVLSYGGGLYNKFRMKIMCLFPYKLLPPALPSTENAVIVMFVLALTAVSP